MWNWLGKVVEPVVGGISKYATEKNEIKKAKLEGEIEVTKAKAEFEVAKFKAKAEREITTDKSTFDLDKMAVAEAAKTFWDEFLVLIYISPLVYALLFAIFGGLSFTGGFVWVLADPSVVFNVFNNLDEWYRWGLVLIGVRYLGFRSLLRKGMEMYSAKKKL